MVSGCCVCGTSRYHAVGSGKTYHRFPKNEALRRRWIAAVGRPDTWVPGKHALLCSAHFRESDFNRTYASNVQTRLNEGAVPSIFDRVPSKKQQSEISKNVSSSLPPEENLVDPLQDSSFLKLSRVPISVPQLRPENGENGREKLSHRAEDNLPPTISFGNLGHPPVTLIKEEMEEVAAPSTSSEIGHFPVVLIKEEVDEVAGPSTSCERVLINIPQPPHENGEDGREKLAHRSEDSFAPTNFGNLGHSPATLIKKEVEEADSPSTSSERALEEFEDDPLSLPADANCSQDIFVPPEDALIRSASPEMNVDRPTALIEKYRKQVRTLQQSSRRMTKTISSLKDVISQLRLKNQMLQDQLQLSESLPQISMLAAQRFGKTRKVSPELRSFALTLHSLSPKAYDFVRKEMDHALPHPRTLARWHEPDQPGVSEEGLVEKEEAQD